MIFPAMNCSRLLAVFLVTALPCAFADDPVADARAAWKARDYTKAAALVATPDMSGHPAALYLRGLMAETGRGAPQSHSAAAKHYHEAMEKGDADATGAYGRYLVSGAGGVTKDGARGLFLIRKAAEAGSVRAMTVMADFAERGVAQDADPRTAVFWYQRAAAEKDPLGYLGMAQLYDRGAAGLPKDEGRATILILEAARLGEPLAMNEMGVRYQAGRGVARDNVAAVGWFSMAAQHDLAAAHVNLGNCYETGNGCLRDYDRAGSSYAAAAKQGHPVGQFMLGALFERGLGTEPKPVFAFVNYSRAAAGGYKNAEAKRDALKATLTAEQLAEAARLLESPAP
jgi:TPR repeat protein